MDNERLIGKAKVLRPIVTNEMAFKHLEELNYDRNNVFLASQKYSGKY